MAYKNPEDKREHTIATKKKRRDAWFAANGPCRCGSWEQLELHHVDRTKKVSHRIWSWSEERRTEELSKCRPLCDICHKEQTKLDRRVHWEHGMRMMYNGGCRCSACRAAQTAYRRVQRAKVSAPKALR